MRKLFTMLGIIGSVLVHAQTAKISIKAPNSTDTTFCLGEILEMKIEGLNPDNFEATSAWYISPVKPDLEFFTNYDQWMSFGFGSDSQAVTIESESYLFVQISDINFGYYTPIVHVKLKGTIPTLMYNSSDTLFCKGSTVAVSASPDNLGDGNYKWLKDGEEIVNATGASYNLDVAGSYSVSVRDVNSDCPDTYIPSKPVTFKEVKPAIYGDYKPDLNRVVLSTDDVYASYRWFKGATSVDLAVIDGQISSSLTVTVPSSDEYYAVEITNSNGCVAMSMVVLINNTLYKEPVIKQPSNTFACDGEIILLELDGGEYTSYQWYKDGNSIWGATNSFIEVSTGWPYNGGGSYSVVVTTELDPSDQLTSDAISLEFATKPSIKVYNNATFCLDAEVVFFVEDIADSVQWYVNDVNDFSNAVALGNDTSQVITVLSEARYYFVKTFYKGCEGVSFSKVVNPYKLYSQSVYTENWTKEGVLCMGDSIGLRAGGYNMTWQWYLNGEKIEGLTDQIVKVNQAGYYHVAVSSIDCPNMDEVLSTDSVWVRYAVEPTFEYAPIGTEYNGKPSHRIYCQGEAIELTLNNSDNYVSYQWFGKLYDPSSPSDDWTEIPGETNATLSFTVGDVPYLHFKLRADSLKSDSTICAGFSDYVTIDAYAFGSPVVASYNNAELCAEGDSTQINLAFPGPWERFEWYLDGNLVPDVTDDTIWVKDLGEWVIMGYPEQCPHIGISSGAGPNVAYMPDAEIHEDVEVIYATPLPVTGFYEYQWYYSAEDPGVDYPANMEPVEDPNTPPYGYSFSLMEDGYYAVEVTNPGDCERVSTLYEYGNIGLTLIEKDDIEVYPTLVDSDLYIKVNNNVKVTNVSIYNVIGELVISQNNVNGAISMVSRTPGIYMVKVELSDHTVQSFKVVKN